MSGGAPLVRLWRAGDPPHVLRSMRQAYQRAGLLGRLWQSLPEVWRHTRELMPGAPLAVAGAGLWAKIAEDCGVPARSRHESAPLEREQAHRRCMGALYPLGCRSRAIALPWAFCFS